MEYGKKKQKKVKSRSTGANHEGDIWIYTCVKRGSYLFLAYSLGSRTQEVCRDMVELVFGRTKLPTSDNKIEIYSDGNDDYTVVLAEYYSENCIVYGQVIKIREGGKVVEKIKKPIYGNPDTKKIETTDVENYNSILRERLGRLVRRTKCISKKKAALNYALGFFQFHWNWMDPLPCKKTPIMIENLSDHIWSWNEFLFYHFAV